MVIGAFAAVGDAEVCLSNLAEVGFTLGKISVVAQDPTLALTLSRAKGPLHARPPAAVWAALRAVGASESALSTYAGALATGGVLIAVTVPASASAVAHEMLVDHQALGVTTTAANPAPLGKRPPMG